MIILEGNFWSFVKSISLVLIIFGLVSFALMSFTMMPFFESRSDATVHISNGSVNASQQENVIPKVLIVNPGAKVKWINDDSVSHTIIPDAPYAEFLSGGFGSPVLKPGESYEYVFREVGTVNYHMTPSPWITGTIHILP